MGKQSSRLYYNGKDHKDIWFNGMYHDAMYYRNQGGIIWQKLRGGTLESLGCAINRYTTSISAYMGINIIYPQEKEIKSKRYDVFDTVFWGIYRNRTKAFGYDTAEAIPYVWATNDGKNWKRLRLSKNVAGFIPCYDGFLYTDSTAKERAYHKVTVDDSNNILSENINAIQVDSHIKTGGNYNGIWKYQLGSDSSYEQSGTKVSFDFTTHTGSKLTYNFGEEYYHASSAIGFTDYINTYMYARVFGMDDDGKHYADEFVLTCDGTQITAKIFDSGSGGFDVDYIIPWQNKFYLFGQDFSGAKRVIRSTDDFVGDTSLVESWQEDDYIELDLLDGSWLGIDKIRVRLDSGLSVYNVASSTTDNIMNITIYRHGAENGNYVQFSVGNVADGGIILQPQVVPSYLYQLGMYFDSPIITKSTKGFAYFLNNIGIGNSYP